MGGKAGVGPAFGLLVCIAAVACDPLFPSLPLLPLPVRTRFLPFIQMLVTNAVATSPCMLTISSSVWSACSNPLPVHALTFLWV